MNDTTATFKNPKRDQFLTDVLTTAVEGGIGYWSKAANYVWDAPAEERGVTLYIEEVNSEEVLLPYTMDDVDYVVRVTLADIEEGIKRILYNETCVVNSTVLQIVLAANAENDAAPDDGPGDIDADVADQIIQAAIFGTVIFG